MTREAFIYDSVRTPRGRGRPDGALHRVTPLELSAHVLRAIRQRSGLEELPVDDVILGIATPIGEQGGDLARFAALRAGYGDPVPGLQVHRFCASGLDACNLAAAQVRSGAADLVVAGGVESMSRVPMASDGGVMTTDPSITGPHAYLPQGVAADVVATLYGFDREHVDAYAVESQRRAALAWSEGRFSRSVVPVLDADGRVVLDRDEHMRPNASVTGLAKLAPAFATIGEQRFDAIAVARYPKLGTVQHVHHAGNSSGVVDGAAAVLIGAEQVGPMLGLRPRARIAATRAIGSDPSIMLTGPEVVARRLLERTGLKTHDIDLWELNEAFASVVLRFVQALELDSARVNVNGGAIAMGHPLGATGAMLVGTIVDELERTGGRRGMVLLCAAGGQASAALIERI
jgi:acetyl-CoA C-acetyltransferase